MVAPSLSQCCDASLVFLEAFDQLTYRGIPVARMLGAHVWCQLFWGGLDTPRYEREFLDRLPGRLFLSLRSRNYRRQLRNWRGGMMVMRSASYGHLMAGVFPHLRAPFGYLATVDTRRPEQLRLAQLVPGRVHPWRAGEIDALYRAGAGRIPALQARLPASSRWLGQLLRIAMDLVDAAHVFWEESGAPGGVLFTHEGISDLALSQVGLRLGRRLLLLPHGYYYDVLMYYSKVADLACTWDRWTARRYRKSSGGDQPVEIVGPFHLPPDAPAPSRTRPEVLFMGGGESAEDLEPRRNLLEQLAAPDAPWTAAWKLHPRSRTIPPLIEELGFRVEEPGGPYRRMQRADLVVSFWSSTLAEARILGRRVLCLASPDESWLRNWAVAHGVPTVDDPARLREIVTASLGVPPARPRLPSPEQACARVAALIDATLSGRDPGTLPGGTGGRMAPAARPEEEVTA